MINGGSVMSGNIFFSALMIIILFIINTLQGQEPEGEVQGTIYSLSREPVPDVYIVIPSLRLMEVSDSNGRFRIPKIVKGIYTVQFVHIGYRTRVIDLLEIKPGVSTDLDSVILESNIYSSNEIIVTASRAERSPDQIPAQVNTVSMNQIKCLEAKTSAEALREETGLFIQKSNHGGGSVIIRGLGSNQILLLVDGIRINNSTFRLGNHQYLTTVDEFMAGQIEVVRGPTSVLYGSDALGGTINVVTRRPGLFSPHLMYHVNFFSRYSSADNEKTARGEFVLSYERLAFQAGYSYKSYGDLRRGANSDYPELEKSTNGVKQTPNSFDAYDVDTKILFGLTPLQTLTFAYQHGRQIDVPRYDKYETENYYHWIYEPQRRDLVYLKYDIILSTRDLTTFTGTVSWHRQEEGREMQKSMNSTFTRENDYVNTTGILLTLNSRYKLHQFTAGSEFYADKVSSSRFLRKAGDDAEIEDSRGRYPDHSTYTSLGIFLQDEVEINRNWFLVPGLRYSFFQTGFSLLPAESADPSVTDFNLAFKDFTGSMGVIYKPVFYLLLRLNLARAFRAPNLNDLSKFGESKGDIFEIPNQDLEPEKLYSMDLGGELKITGLTFKVAVFYSDIRDLIASADAYYNGSPVLIRDSVEYKIKSKQNIGKANIQGIESGFEYNFYRQFFLYGNWTATYGQNTDLNEPVGGIPPAFGLAGLGWHASGSYIDLYFRFAARQDRLSADDRDDPRIPPGGTPGWWIINLRTGWHWYEKSMIRFSVENIFDYNYREHGSGLNGPGRNFILSLEVNF